MAAFQDAGVATLEAEGEDVEADVGTCLEDDADDTEGYAHTAQVQAVGKGALLCDDAKGRGQRGDMTHVRRYAPQPLRRQEQAVVERGGREGLQVERIGSKKLFLRRFNAVSYSEQDVVALFVRKEHQGPTCFFGLLK